MVRVFHRIAIVLLFAGLILDPVGKFYYLRYISFGLALFCVLILGILGGLSPKIKSSSYVFLLFGCVLTPLYGLILYSFRTLGGKFTDTSYIAGALILASTLIFNDIRNCRYALKIFIASLRILSILIFAAALAQVYGFVEFIVFLNSYDIARVNVRDYSGVSLPYIYLLASPLLIYLAAHDYYKFRLSPSFLRGFSLIASLVALALSGTRAHQIIALGLIPAFEIILPSSKRLPILLLAFTLLGVFVALNFNFLYQVFDPSQDSLAFRNSILSGYGELLTRPIEFFVGQGYNAHEWSFPLRKIISLEIGASKTEYTYFELLRVYGLVLGSVFLCSIALIVYDTKHLPKEFAWVFPALVIYLFNSFFQPYLFSGIGLVPLGLFSAMVSSYDANRISGASKN